MTDNQNIRTLICSVVFLDIVEYSRQPVADQIRLKDLFNTLLAQALREVPVTDRIILDTGDGAALSLIGDPEDALFVATNFRDAAASLPPGQPSALRTRIGINLGPVRLVKDINGQPNIIGDGINVAQRVMTFAEPGQVLVSRSYHEVVSCLSDDYSKLFQYEGARTDKHIREHEVYTISATIPGIRRRSQAKRDDESRTSGPVGLAREYADRTATTIKESVHGKPLLATALTAIVILGAAVVVRGYRGHAASESTPGTASIHQPRVATPESRSAPAEVTANATVKSAPAPKALSANQPAAAPRLAAVKPATVPGATEKGAMSRTPSSAAVVETAFVALSITPWGEVYVDDKKMGVSPPLREIRIAVGKHKIEVRNTSFPRHIEVVDAKAGEQIRIKHKFQ
jgi:hypothetical protein